MRILVTGAGGMVGRDLVPELARAHSVTATGADRLDVCDPGQVTSCVESLRPDLIVHLAASTDVDACEQAPDETFRRNTLATQIVAAAAARVDAAVLFMSSISVFSGQKPIPYVESDEPGPINVYSRSKLAAEGIIRTLVPRHYIVRTTGLFGGGAHDKKFVGKILERARRGAGITVVDDVYTSPTSTQDLARGLCWLITTEIYGTLHMVNQGMCTRFHYADAVLRAAALDTGLLAPVPLRAFPLGAPRPRMEAALNERLQSLGVDPMRPWEEALAEYVHTVTTQ